MNSRMISDEKQDEEARIVERAVEGSRQAFSLLFNQYYDSLNRYFFFRLGNQQEAEDLTGIIFLKVWQNLRRFNPSKGTFKAWLYRIAHNTLIDQYRKKRDEISLNEVQDFIIEGTKPEEEIITKQKILQLKKALDHLDERSRSVIVYRFIAGLDHHETAQLLGISDGNVRVIQLRALEKVKGFFAEDDDG